MLVSAMAKKPETTRIPSKVASKTPNETSSKEFVSDVRPRHKLQRPRMISTTNLLPMYANKSAMNPLKVQRIAVRPRQP